MRREVHVRFCERLAVRFRGPTLPFGPHCYKKDGSWYTGASPSKKSVARLKQKVGDHLVPSQVGTWPEVRDQLNLMLKGWALTSATVRAEMRTKRSIITSMIVYDI